MSVDALHRPSDVSIASASDRHAPPLAKSGRVLVLIPAFNEERTLGRVLASAQACIEDILVIDDGSVDATARIARESGVMLRQFPKNMGKGEALKAGFAYALQHDYSHVITLDADGQHDPADIPALLEIADRFDLILGNRMGDAERVPRLRRLANQTSSLIVSLLCGRRVLDSQTGFRAYSAALLRELQLKSSRFDLETEVVIKAARRGLRIGHCRIQTIYGEEKSRFRNVADSLKFLVVALKSLRY